MVSGANSIVANLFVNNAIEGSYIQKLSDAISQVEQLSREDVVAEQLSDITDDLGDIRAGRFISGENDPDGDSFTGTIITWPPVTVDGNTYTLVGLNNGTLQVGLDALTGSIVFAGRDGVLDENGLTFYVDTTQKQGITWWNNVLNERFAYIEAYYNSGTKYNNLTIQVENATGGSSQININAKALTLNGSSSITLNTSNGYIGIGSKDNSPSASGLGYNTYFNTGCYWGNPQIGHGLYTGYWLKDGQMGGVGAMYKAVGASFLGRLVFLTNSAGSTTLTQRAWIDDEGIESSSAFIGSEITTPANPASGKRKLYAKSDGWYDLDSSGTETLIGSGSTPVTSAEIDPSITQCRLSTSNSLPIYTSDTTDGNLYLLPYKGNKIAIYDGSSSWELVPFSGAYILVPLAYKTTANITNGSAVITVPSTANMAVGQNIQAWDGDLGLPTLGASVQSIDSATQITMAGNAKATGTIDVLFSFPSAKNIDVFAYNNSGYIGLNYVIWTNNTTRSLALTKQDGIYVKTGATTHKYIGTFRTSDTDKVSDSVLQRFVWNYYHRADRPLSVTEATDTWTYSTATWRQANNTVDNKVEIVIGLAEEPVELTATAVTKSSSTTDRAVSTGVGVDSTSANSAQTFGAVADSTLPLQHSARYIGYPSAGYHYYAWLEIGTGADTQTWYGDNGGTVMKTGMVGRIRS